jgi:hypothetical protein
VAAGKFSGKVVSIALTDVTQERPNWIKPSKESASYKLLRATEFLVEKSVNTTTKS